MRKYFLLLIAILVSVTLSYSQESAKEIVQKMDEYVHGNSMELITKIEIVRPDWTKEMKIKSWTLNRTEYAIIYVEKPVSDNGVSYLKRQNEAWNWQPSIEKALKLPPSMMMQSWMGSDIKNDDLMKASSLVVHYTHSLLNDTIVDDIECYSVQLLPKEDASVVWGKIILNISKKHNLVLFAKYFDEDGFLIRNIHNYGVKKYGSKWYYSTSEVLPMEEPGNKTISHILSVKWDINIKESYFSIRNMKNLQ